MGRIQDHGKIIIEEEAVLLCQCKEPAKHHLCEDCAKRLDEKAKEAQSEIWDLKQEIKRLEQRVFDLEYQIEDKE